MRSLTRFFSKTGPTVIAMIAMSCRGVQAHGALPYHRHYRPLAVQARATQRPCARSLT